MAVGTPVATQLGFGTVTGQLVAADVSSDGKLQTLQGSVTFTPAISRIGAQYEEVIILPKPKTVYLDSNGSFSVRLVASDDDELNVMAWNYNVSFNLDDNVVVKSFPIRVYRDKTVDLANAMPAAANQGQLISRGAPGAITDILAGTVQTVTNGTPASFTIRGTGAVKYLDLVLPAGPTGPNPTQTAVDSAVTKAISDNQLLSQSAGDTRYPKKTDYNTASGPAQLDSNGRLPTVRGPAKLETPVPAAGSTDPVVKFRSGDSADPVVVFDSAGTEIGRFDRLGGIIGKAFQGDTVLLPTRAGTVATPRISEIFSNTDTGNALQIADTSNNLRGAINNRGVGVFGAQELSTVEHIRLNGKSLRQSGNKLQVYDTAISQWVPVTSDITATFERNSEQSIPLKVETPIAWNSKVNDPNNYFAWNQSTPALSASQIRLPFAGSYTYDLKFDMYRQNNWRMYMLVKINGISQPTHFVEFFRNTSDVETTFLVHNKIRVSAGSVLTMELWQDSNFNQTRTIIYDTTKQPKLTVSFVGHND